jgi:hypothetical protein
MLYFHEFMLYFHEFMLYFVMEAAGGELAAERWVYGAAHFCI